MRSGRLSLSFRFGRCIAVVVTVSTVFLLVGCARNTEFSTGQIEEAQRPSLQESWDIVLNISEAGTPLIRIAAWHMERYDDPDSLFTLLNSNRDEVDDRVMATFYDSIGVESAKLTAQRIRFDEDGERLVAGGDVRVRASSGRYLQAETLHWDQRRRQITVPGFVYLETEDEKIRGFELTADEDLDNYVIRRITGTVVIRENQE